jgi:hypothetical protein
VEARRVCKLLLANPPLEALIPEIQRELNDGIHQSIFPMAQTKSLQTKRLICASIERVNAAADKRTPRCALDVLGGGYPSDCRTDDARIRWDLACLLAATELFPYIDYAPPLLAIKVNALYGSDFPTGDAHYPRGFRCIVHRRCGRLT